MTLARLSVILICLFTMLPGHLLAGDDSLAPTADAKVFVEWLDTGNPATAWQQLTPLAQVIKNQERWQNLHLALRSSYGRLLQRTVRGVTLQQRYPMLPDGRYAIVQFDTVFQNKPATIETVVLVLDADGNWLVHDYILN